MSSPLPGSGEEGPSSGLAVSGSAVRADDHFLGNLLALPAGIIRVVLFAFARFVRADEAVGPGTMRVLLAAPSHDEVLAGSTGRNDAATQRAAEHGNEPMDGPSGWLMARRVCTPLKGGGTEDRCSGSFDPEQPGTRNGGARSTCGRPGERGGTTERGYGRTGSTGGATCEASIRKQRSWDGAGGATFGWLTSERMVRPRAADDKVDCTDAGHSRKGEGAADHTGQPVCYRGGQIGDAV